jgi:hypothetical protein
MSCRPERHSFYEKPKRKRRRRVRTEREVLAKGNQNVYLICGYAPEFGPVFGHLNFPDAGWASGIDVVAQYTVRFGNLLPLATINKRNQRQT